MSILLSLEVIDETCSCHRAQKWILYGFLIHISHFFESSLTGKCACDVIMSRDIILKSFSAVLMQRETKVTEEHKKSLARSSLEYASPIWNPTNMTQTNQIERVQHKFIKILARRYYNDSSFLTDYQWYEERLNLPSLKLRRIILDVNFAIKSFNKQIDSSTYIDLFNFRVPSRTTRQNQVFSLNASRINGRVSVMNRIMQNFNDHVNDIDALSGNSITKNFASNITTNYYNSV